MIIKLLPASPQPTILFAVTFANIPDGLPLPIGWGNQLHALALDGIDPPESLHTLDKSSRLCCLVEEVIFDVPTMIISCRFIDGTIEEWPLMASKCLQALADISDDVNEAALETERERDRERAKEREDELKQAESLNSPPPTVRVTKHKKQRSLLMSLVASIGPLFSPPSSPSASKASSRAASPGPSTLTFTPPPSPAILDVRPRSALTPRALRRRARSTLVETYRMFVLRELRTRMPEGGYYVWALQSMLRRASAQLDHLFQMPGLGLSSELHSPRIPSEPFYADEGGDVEDTDTDGSSVHTPSSSHFTPGPNDHHALRQISSEQFYQQDVSPPRQSHDYLQTDVLADYKALTEACARLRHLLIASNARLLHAATEQMHQERALEIRGRRRAWLNKTLIAGNRGANNGVGLSMPFAKSPLSQSWSGDDFEFVRHFEVHKDEEQERTGEYDELEEKMGLGLRRTRSRDITTLFPVSEEEEENLDERGFELEQYELELGSRPEFDSDWAVYNRLDGRLSKHVRVRTTSMHRDQSTVKTPIELGIVSSQPLPVSSILCQPLDMQGSCDKATPPVYSEVDEVSYGTQDHYVGEEFTLAMDIPFTVRMEGRTHTHLPRRKTLTVSAVDRSSKEQEHDWIQPPVTLQYAHR